MKTTHPHLWALLRGWLYGLLALGAYLGLTWLAVPMIARATAIGRRGRPLEVGDYIGGWLVWTVALIIVGIVIGIVINELANAVKSAVQKDRDESDQRAKAAQDLIDREFGVKP